MKDFTSLAQASKIIGKITENAKVMHSESASSFKGDIIRQITDYLHELFTPLYDTEIEFSMSYHCLNIHKRNGYIRLYKNIHMGGWADTLDIVINKDWNGRFNAQSTRMTVEIAQAWGRFKTLLLERIENELSRYNKSKKEEVEKMAKELYILENFKV